MHCFSSACWTTKDFGEILLVHSVFQIMSINDLPWMVPTLTEPETNNILSGQMYYRRQQVKLNVQLRVFCVFPLFQFTMSP